MPNGFQAGTTAHPRGFRAPASLRAVALAGLFLLTGPAAASGSAAHAALDPPERLALQRCGVDAAEFDRLLALDQAAFDQDFDGGWRAVASGEGCRLAAATLIEAYLLHSRPSPPPSPLLLRWHAGQMLAMAGQVERSLAYFEGAYERGDDPDTVAWNLYVEGTLAFLRRDRDALVAAREALAAQPVSEEEKAARRQFLEDNPRIRMPEGFIDKPQNLDVLERLLACFDGPYEQAYGGQCGN